MKTGFQLYCEEQSKKLEESTSDKDRLKMISVAWKGLSEADKSSYLKTPVADDGTMTERSAWLLYLKDQMKGHRDNKIKADARFMVVKSAWKALSLDEKETWVTVHLLAQRRGDFAYERCGVTPNSQTKDVPSVQFDIGRYGNLTHTIQFRKPVSELDAIEAAEKWLNYPLSEEEATSLDEAEDVRVGEFAGDYEFRFEALGCCTMLDAIERNGSAITLVCGS